MPLLTGQPRVSSARAAWRRRGGSTGPRAQERLGKREREGRRESELRRFGDAARPPPLLRDEPPSELEKEGRRATALHSSCGGSRDAATCAHHCRTSSARSSPQSPPNVVASSSKSGTTRPSRGPARGHSAALQPATSDATSSAISRAPGLWREKARTSRPPCSLAASRASVCKYSASLPSEMPEMPPRPPFPPPSLPPAAASSPEARLLCHSPLVHLEAPPPLPGAGRVSLGAGRERRPAPAEEAPNDR